MKIPVWVMYVFLAFNAVYMMIGFGLVMNKIHDQHRSIDGLYETFIDIAKESRKIPDHVFHNDDLE